jgi:hypothetical protein
MKRIILWAFVFVAIAHGCESGFESCLQKVNDLHVVQNDTLQIPLKQKKLLIYSNKPLNNTMKSDPFLGLYLIKAKYAVSHPFKFHKTLPYSQLASVSTGITCGNITHPQKGLEHLATFSSPLQQNGVVLTSCCELVGVATPRGIIQKRYIQHFLEKGGVYGEIGVRVMQKDKKVKVCSVNRFINRKLFIGDIIVSVNKKTIHNVKEFNEAVLFAKIGSVVQVELIRDNKKIQLSMKVMQRKGGGLLSDTFFEAIGVYFDPTLHVIASTNPSLHVGDRIFSINKKAVKNYKDMRLALSSIEDIVKIGITRKGLDFFITLNSKN